MKIHAAAKIELDACAFLEYLCMDPERSLTVAATENELLIFEILWQFETIYTFVTAAATQFIARLSGRPSVVHDADEDVLGRNEIGRASTIVVPHWIECPVERRRHLLPPVAVTIY